MSFQILAPEFLKKYPPNELVRIGNAYFLKPGVQPKPGTTKEVGDAVAGASMSIDEQLKAIGLSDATIRNLTDDQKQMFAAIGAAIKSQYDANKVVPPSFTTDDLNRIMGEAQSDPNINQYYKDQLRVGAEEFQRAVTSLGGDYQAAKSENERQFGYQRRELTEAEAAAGRAFSGFRRQAEDRLKQDQSSVIESSRRQLKKNLESIGSSFESQYGTDALKKEGVPSIDTESYKPVGDMPGDLEQRKLVDIEQKKQDIIQTELLSGGPTHETPSDAGTVKTSPEKKQTPRQKYESKGWTYLGNMKDVQANIRKGKTVKKLEGSYYFK